MICVCVELVCEGVLVVIGCILELGEWLILGLGEMKFGGYCCDLILVDVVEVVVVVIYLDVGFEVCWVVVLFWFSVLIEVLLVFGWFEKDFKICLQEWLQV